MTPNLTEEPESTTLNTPPPILRAELDRFAERHGMTTREYDILFLLVSGYCSVSMIAERLGLSRNTVHNHFKNVFRRTRTNSKAGVLALLVREALGSRSDVRPFVRRPRVLVIDHDGYSGPLLVESLQRRGLQVYLERSADRLIQRVSHLRIDAVVAEATLTVADGRSILDAMREHYGTHPVVLLTTEQPEQPVSEWLARGAGGLFERPVSADRLAFAILEHVIDSPYERNRLVRVDTDLRARLNRESEARITNLSFEGAFIALPSREMVDLEDGERVEIELELDDQTPLTLHGEVVWRSARPRPSMPSGFGIRFVDLNERERTRVEEFVRRRKLADLSSGHAFTRVA